MTHPDDLLPEGLADALPAEAAAIGRAMRAVLDAMDARGYDRVRPPLVETEEKAGKDMIARLDKLGFTMPGLKQAMAVAAE